MKAYYLEDGSKILVDDTKPIGSGGEGSVFKLQKNPNILVKIYAERALDRMPEIEHKIKAMVRKKPGLLDYNGLTIIAWPSYVVYNEHKRFVGYLMKRVQAKNQLSHVITPGLQKTKFPNITWYDRLVIAINLAKVTSFLHKNDTVIGDINTSDFFVYPGFEIGVVDTDSFQVTSEQRIFHCKVFTPDYTPPEVIDAKKLTQYEIKRIPNHDNYGIAILIFQILMMGVHPFSARIKGILGFDGNAINYNMEKEIFPYHPFNPSIIPPKNAMPFSFLPKYIQDLFIRAFDKNKHVINRPTSDEWVTGLRQLKEHLKKCKRDKSHYYPDHFQKCPHCAREGSKDYDFLLEHFKTISRKYVTYETDLKPIIVDENHAYDETIVSKSYSLKKGKDLAIFFHPKMMDKYQLEDRIKALKIDPSYQKLKPYITAPKELIFDHHKPKVIGYVSSYREPLYRLSQFLKTIVLVK
jgi:DNA-binding helix-hairpin-helix protein with protein kinase domain